MSKIYANFILILNYFIPTLVIPQNILMKSILFFSIITFVLLSNTYGQKTIEKEIKKIIELESKAFYERDFTKWCNYYIQTDKTYWSCVETDGVLEGHGWVALKKLVGDYLKENPNPLNIIIERDTYIFHLYNNQPYAWVTFNEHQTLNGKKSSFRSTRILEKQKGEWKIVYMLSYPVK